MNEPLITGGYILLSRKLIESKIMKKPPLYLKVWVWLLLKAQHEPYKGLDRGEWMTSVSEIQEAMSWMVGYRKTTPTYKQIRNVLDWLRNPCEGNTNGNTKDGMIDTTKGTHGIKIKILNYDFYQDPKNYEGHNERQRKGTSKEARWATQGHNINKNDKNDKNDKNNKNNIFIPPTLEEVTSYCKERNNSVDPQRFIDFYTSKGWLVGKVKMKDWKAAVRTWERRDSEKNTQDFAKKYDYDGGDTL